MIYGPHLRAIREPWAKRVSLLIADYREPVYSVVKPNSFVFEAIEEGAIREPSLYVGDDAAQKLMDDLWDCGLRPSEGSGSAGQLAATQRHLEDMKKVAFHSLKIRE